MLTQTRQPVKPLSRRTQYLVTRDVEAMVADDLRDAERRGDWAEVELCEREIAQLEAEIDRLTDGRGW